MNENIAAKENLIVLLNSGQTGIRGTTAVSRKFDKVIH